VLPEPASDALPPRRSRLFAGVPALRHRNFRLFVVGQGISLIGYWMQSVAQGWLVYRLNGRPVDLGKVAFAGYLPILFLAPLAGVVADRLPRRPVLLVTQSLLMLLAFGLGVVVARHAATVPIVIGFAAAGGLVGALDIPTRQSFLVEMSSPEDLPNAIAVNSSIFNGARVIGPAIAGSLVSVAGEAACFLLNSASYLAVLAALLRMRLPRATRARHTQPLGAGFVSGLRYVWGVPALRSLLMLLGIVCALGAQYVVLMPVFAKTVFGAGAEGYGLLLTAAGIGSVSSSVHLATRHYSRAQHRRQLLLGLGMFAVAVIGVAASPRFEVALLCQIFAGWGLIRYLATTNTLLQLIVDEPYRGRMMGLHAVMFLGTQPFGGLALGALAQGFGARRAALVSGGASLAAALWLAVRLRRVASRERGVEAVAS
jgi:MFS family permease